MQRSALTAPGTISLILILQLIPFVLFPPQSFSGTSQEWWLPVLLGIMVLVADFQIIVRRTPNLSPWNLLAFAQGFNIISRLMMVWAHATISVNKTIVPNWPYLILTLASMALSVFVLWYTEKSEVRMAFLPK